MPNVVTCPRCDAKWVGLKIEHCSVAGCHLTFTSTRAGDRHLVEMDPVTGKSRHLTAAELAAAVRRSGRYEGTPHFQVTTNPYGTQLWSEHNPQPRSFPREQRTDGPTGGE